VGFLYLKERMNSGASQGRVFEKLDSFRLLGDKLVYVQSRVTYIVKSLALLGYRYAILDPSSYYKVLTQPTASCKWERGNPMGKITLSL
jgi:hypothetical protein